MASSLVVERRLRKLLLGLLAGLIVSACAAQRDQSVDWHEGDAYSGRVIDGATGRPIEGAVVVAKWQILQRLPLNSTTERIIRLEETLTDKDGRFQISALDSYAPPSGWEREGGAFPLLLFFKPGYDPSGYNQFTWENGDPQNVGKHVPLTIGWSRDVPLFRYTTGPFAEARSDDPIYRRMTEEQKILDRLIPFASTLEQNVRTSREGGGSLTPQRAVEAQWRAIVMVDEEVRKYRPKHQWAATEISSALREMNKPQGTR